MNDTTNLRIDEFLGTSSTPRWRRWAKFWIPGLIVLPHGNRRRRFPCERSYVDRVPQRTHRRFLDRLAQGRVRVHDRGHVLQPRAAMTERAVGEVTAVDVEQVERGSIWLAERSPPGRIGVTT